eukprot:TRINITY_DN22002_c0_g1_i2.p1 TRINITY_DN22002_c0_g1~~TRINITY_DN22002_c0_g1_i2.p1  ORF type:complete len:114 (+),score=13.89 TRINITY_DN22002_c0_g1_i2:72-413(+)
MGCGASDSVSYRAGERVEVRDGDHWLLGTVVETDSGGKCMVTPDGWKTGPYTWREVVRVPDVTVAPPAQPLKSALSARKILVGGAPPPARGSACVVSPPTTCLLSPEIVPLSP